MKTTYIKPTIEEIVLQDFMENKSIGLTRASSHNLGKGDNKFIIRETEPGDDDYIDDCAKFNHSMASLWDD